MATKSTGRRPAKAARPQAEPASEVSAEATDADVAAPDGTAADAVPSGAAPSDAAPSDTSEDEFVPANRAERRAKGRGKGNTHVPGGRGKVAGGHGPAQTQRNWANRRSG